MFMWQQFFIVKSNHQLSILVVFDRTSVEAIDVQPLYVYDFNRRGVLEIPTCLVGDVNRWR